MQPVAFYHHTRTRANTPAHGLYLPGSPVFVVAADGWDCYQRSLWGVKHEEFITRVREACAQYISTRFISVSPWRWSGNAKEAIVGNNLIKSCLNEIIALSLSEVQPRGNGTAPLWIPSCSHFQGIQGLKLWYITVISCFFFIIFPNFVVFFQYYSQFQIFRLRLQWSSLSR